MPSCTRLHLRVVVGGHGGWEGPVWHLHLQDAVRLRTTSSILSRPVMHPETPRPSTSTAVGSPNKA
ncbi:hypothetical protein CHLRE_11g467571v5 [Chlamydomonas reinhardtii]|uniref:Uncharacterized protein n=1 Tax=Chlamydomonas reinhardtii TaxID=3055 RepID=A0A2K3D7B0_CHLRE|nr:uncharacterized protein CHLRE_11g467571v5 [Chlamydomonas reinhardtii]PNW76416.1 hypothetical protein CHLRE_11g467571v5 [Chlamydomonas reinhardtii]